MAFLDILIEISFFLIISTIFKAFRSLKDPSLENSQVHTITVSYFWQGTFSAASFTLYSSWCIMGLLFPYICRRCFPILIKDAFLKGRVEYELISVSKFQPCPEFNKRKQQGYNHSIYFEVDGLLGWLCILYT